MRSWREPPAVQRSVSYFDGVVERWTGEYAAPTAAGHVLRERRRRVLELLGPPPQGRHRLLDLGCGSAPLAPALEAAGWAYAGLDGSAAMLGAAPAGLPLAVADVTQVPLPSASVEAVICLGVLDRVSGQRKAAAEIARVLVPGGRAVVSFPHRGSPYARWASDVFRPAVGVVKRWGGREAGAALDSRAILHSVASATALFPAEGPDAVDVSGVRYFFFTPLLSPLDEISPRGAETLTRRLEGLHRGPLRRLGAGFLLSVDKCPR